MQINRRKLLEQFKESVKKHRSIFCLIFTLEILGAVYFLVNPKFVEFFIDYILLGKRVECLSSLCVITVGLYLCYCLIDYWAKQLRISTINKVMLEIKMDCMSAFLYGDRKGMCKYMEGDVEHIFSEDFNVLEKFFQRHIVDFGISFLLCGATAIAMVFIQWKLLLVCIFIIPIPYVAMKIIGKINYERVKKRRDIYGEYEGFLIKSLGNWKNIKLQNIQKNQLRIFFEYRHGIANYDIQSGYLEYLGNMLSFLSEILATRVVIYLMGGLLIMNGSITIGNLLLFISYFEYFYAQIKKLNQLQYEFTSDLPSLLKICELLQVEVDKTGVYESLHGNIDFSKVSFSYAEGTIVLENIDLCIKAGEKVAIVGANGSGKSSLLKLLLKMNRIYKGMIQLDGKSLEEITNTTYIENIGAVLQNFHVFDVSFYDNVRMFVPEASDKEIEELYRRVGLSNYIESLPDKYCTLIGNDGARLSGGQRQRLALARVLLGKKNIVILDEVSSAMDVESERNIFSMLFKEFRKSTIIYVSHREAPLLLADRIIVLDKGRIVGDGKHHELFQDNIYYKRIFGEGQNVE